MAELVDLLKYSFYTRKSAVQDVHDSGGPYTLTTTYAKYVNDASTRNYVTFDGWDEVSNHLDCSGLAVGSKLDIKVDSTVAANNKGAVIYVKFECPNGGFPFTLEEIKITVQSNVQGPEQWKMLGYVGPEVQQYGIDIYSKVESGTVAVSSRKLLWRA